MPLAHVSWAVADNAARQACDAFFLDVFGAEIAFEMLVTPEAAALGLDREERLMMVGDTMIIAPPLVISRAEIDELVEKARKCLDLTWEQVRSSV